MEKYPRLEKLCDWPLVVGFLLGMGFVAFIVYPPAPGWGSNEKWGDIGTWLGAVTTAGTAVIALWIANGDRRDRKRRQKTRGMLLATDVYGMFNSVRTDLSRVRRTARNAESVLTGRSSSEVEAQLRIPSAAHLPRGYLLEDVPEGLARAIAAVGSALRVYDAFATTLAAEHSAQNRASEVSKMFDLDAMLDQLQLTLATAAGEIERYGGPAPSVDYFDRGDGTQIKR